MATKSYTSAITVLNGRGNGPYVYGKVKGYTCTVDTSPNAPWSVVFSSVKMWVKITDVGLARSSKAKLTGSSYNGGWIGTNGVSKEVKGKLGGAEGENTNSSDSGLIQDVRTFLGYTPEAHVTKSGTFQFHYSYEGYAAGALVSSYSEYITKSGDFYTPLVVGNGGWGSTSSSGNKYIGNSIYFSGSWGGLESSSGVSPQIRLYVGGTWVATGSGASGSIGGNWSTNNPGTYTVALKVFYNGSEQRTLSSTTVTVSTPPPTPPTMGSVNNTTYSSIDTSKAKTLSASWGVSYGGYPSSTITYEWHCYSTRYGELNSGTTTSTSTSFSWNMPDQDIRDNIYWKVRAKNSTGWSGYNQSDNVEVYWAYTEPAKISAGSVSPNRFQLVNGSTTILYTATSNIGSWGDRPGTRTVEYALTKNDTVLKWYGRNTTSSTGSYPLNLSYSVPEEDLNSTYSVVAYKRLNDTEYTASLDARYPTTGDNHVTLGNIIFYEVIGRATGSLSLEPSIIISGLPNELKYNWTYDKQSSEKVDFFVEVYNETSGRVIDIFNLDTNISSSRTYSGSTTRILVPAQQAAAYQIRLKATVTELLGNTHTYTLSSLSPQVHNPPVGSMSLNNVSLPLPSTNPNSILAKQATDITWDYTYSFQGVNITKAVVVVTSEPYGREEFELPIDSSISPYYNSYTRVSKGDFKLGTDVIAYMNIYYQIIGSSKTYSVQTQPLTIHITPTRYVYYLTRVGIGEKELNLIHPCDTSDETSEKIHID